MILGNFVIAKRLEDDNLRNEIPDWLKGIAITLMVYGHVTHIGSASLLQKSIVDIIYTFHMPIFLIISGFYLNTGRDILLSAVNLGRKLIIPYFLFISIYLIGLILISMIGIHTNNSPPESVINFFEIIFFHPRGAYWFLHSLILLQLSILAIRCFLFFLNMKKSILIILVVCIIAIWCQIGLLLPRTAAYFLVGMAMRKFANDFPSGFIPGLLLIICIIALDGLSDIFTFSFMQLAWVFSVMLLLGGLGGVLSNTKLFKILIWIGRNSLVILLLHAIFVVILKPFGPILLHVESSGFFYSIFVTGFTLMGAIAFAMFIDILKISRFIFGTEKIYVKR